jgi:hypothetical protein
MTIRRGLMDRGYPRHKALAKPPNTELIRTTRLAWAKEREHWTVEDWSRILWTGETWMTYSCHRPIYVTSRSDEGWDLTTTRDKIQRKAGWMFWGTFAGAKKVPSLFWEKEWGTIRSESYQVSSRSDHVLCEYCTAFVSLTIQARIVPLIEGWIQHERQGGVFGTEEPVHLTLMQDSAPAHACRSTREDLAERGIECLSWPPYSPDLNPIENCFNWMKDYQGRKWGDSYANLNEERQRILECWELAVTEERLLENLQTMPERIADVI